MFTHGRAFLLFDREITVHLISIRCNPDKPASRMGDQPSMDFDAQRAARAYAKGAADTRAGSARIYAAALDVFGPATDAGEQDPAASALKRSQHDAELMDKNAKLLIEGSGFVRLPVSEVEVILQMESGDYVDLQIAKLGHEDLTWREFKAAQAARKRAAMPVPPMKDEVYRSAQAPRATWRAWIARALGR